MATWSNALEVDEYASLFRKHEILGPAARFLQQYRDLINQVSDGWHLWGAGTRPASGLDEILWKARTQTYRRELSYKEPTIVDVQKEVRRIRSFVARNRYLKDRKIVLPFEGDPQPKKTSTKPETMEAEPSLTFSLSISLDSDDVQELSDVSVKLRALADHLSANWPLVRESKTLPGTLWAIRDVNGNRIGHWTITRNEEEV